MKTFCLWITLTTFIVSTGFAQMGKPVKLPDLSKIFPPNPSWTVGSNIYEVNLRQYSEAGTFKEFEKHIPRLKKMGVDILWFMPIHPIGEIERKGSLGSYYAVKDYKAVNPEHGTMEEFKRLVKVIHDNGMHVIIDWVANHTSPDNVWVKTHPEYFTRNDKGQFIPPVDDWSDVIDLNYENQELRAAMIDALKFWITETGIDGYRCDVAEMVPVDFWREAYKELYKIKPDVFMLAEGEKPELHLAFHMTYTWSLFHDMVKVAKGEKTVALIDEYMERVVKEYQGKAYRMYFTSNHDENSWNGTEYEFFGEGARAFAVLTATIPGMPLIYSGQEAGLNKRLKFFDKDVIDWSSFPNEQFYTRLLTLKRNNEALKSSEVSAAYKRIANTANDKVFSYARTGKDDEVIVVLNLSPAEQTIKLDHLFSTEYEELFTQEKIKSKNMETMTLKPWDYKVYVKK
jgi:glycosidase